MSATSTVLVTGANRGIGKGLVAEYLNRPGTTVVATARKTSNAESLRSLPKAPGSRLIVVEMEFTSIDSIHGGIASLTSEHNVDSLDVVIANAGIADMNFKLIETKVSDIQRYIDINAYGQFEFFKAVAPLLRRSKNDAKGKFMYMSSNLGSLTDMSNFVPMSSYGASKALGNYLFKWLSIEQQDIIIWAQHPGMVATDMANIGADYVKSQGIDIAALVISVQQSCQGMLQVIDNATFEAAQGKFFGPDGKELAW